MRFASLERQNQHMKAMRVAILASHLGKTADALMAACEAGTVGATIALVISNNSRAFVLDRARERRIPGLHLSGTTHPDPTALDEEILAQLSGHDVDVVLLAGYMKRLGPKCIDAFPGRVLNLHPSLLPKYGGKGMFGDAIHSAVLASGDRETGVTLHAVTSVFDAGDIVAQVRVPVARTDTVDTLRDRVLTAEAALVIRVMREFASR